MKEAICSAGGKRGRRTGVQLGSGDKLGGWGPPPPASSAAEMQQRQRRDAMQQQRRQQQMRVGLKQGGGLTCAGGVHEPGGVDEHADRGAVAAAAMEQRRQQQECRFERQGRPLEAGWQAGDRPPAIHALFELPPFPSHPQPRPPFSPRSPASTLTRCMSGQTRACRPRTGRPGGPCWSAPCRWRPARPTWGTPTGPCGSR